MDESEVLRYAFMEYAKSVSLITEKENGKIYNLFQIRFSSMFQCESYNSSDLLQ